MNITLDDTSPQFNWLSKGDTWAITHDQDPFTADYFQGTFHATYTDGDGVRLKFNGTAIYIYGARRGNHGLYSVKMDNGNPVYQLGYSETEDIQQLLFYQAGLDANSEHTIELTNLPSMTDPPANATNRYWFDIDYAVITTALTGEAFTTIYDDASPYIVYSGTGWSRGPAASPERYNQRTSHITQVPGDVVSLNFNGSSIQVFGALAQDRGFYQVALDGLPRRNLSGFWPELQTGVSLFAAAGLDDGPHEIVLTNVGLGVNGGYFELDYVVVNSTIDPHLDMAGSNNGTNTTSGTVEPVDNATAKSSSIGAIAGGAAGGGVALVLLCLLVWYLIRRRRRARESNRYSEPIDLTGDEVKPYVQPGDGRHLYAAAAGHDTSQDYISTLPSGSDDQTGSQGLYTPRSRPFITVIPPPPASNATSYPRSVNPPSSIGSVDSVFDNPFTGGSGSTNESGRTPNIRTTFAQPIPGVSSVGTASTESSPTMGPPTPTPGASRKGSSVGLPYTARSPVFPSGTASTGRMRREGRESDMGPMRISEENVAGEDILPPDYQQATEPLPGQRSPGADSTTP